MLTTTEEVETMDEQQIMYDEEGRELSPMKAGNAAIKLGEMAATPIGAAVALNAAMPWYMRVGGALVGYAGIKKWVGPAKKFLGRNNG